MSDCVHRCAWCREPLAAVHAYPLRGLPGVAYCEGCAVRVARQWLAQAGVRPQEVR